MSEANVTSGLMAVARETAALSDGAVVFADTGILDATNARDETKLIFWPAETWENVDGMNQGPVWNIPAWLVVPFTDWVETYTTMRTVRQQIIDAMGGDGWSANGLAGVRMRRIWTQGTGYDYGAGVDAIQPGMMPLNVVHIIMFEVEEF